MKITITDPKAFAAALKAASLAIEPKPTLPILTTALITARDMWVEITGSDLATTIQVIPSGVTIQAIGAICLPAKTLIDLLSTASETAPITLTVDNDNNIARLSGGLKAKINGLDPDEYPPLRDALLKRRLSMGGGAFIQAVSAVVFACAKEDTRPILTCVNWSPNDQLVTLAAADGFRLAITSTLAAWHERGELNIPAEGLRHAARLFNVDEDVDISANDQCIIIRQGGVLVEIARMDGKFPDYRSIIPKAPTTSATTDKRDLLTAIRRAAIFAQDSAYSGRVEWGDAALTIKGRSMERGDSEDVMAAQTDGLFASAFNLAYLKDAVDSLPAEQVMLLASIAEAPLVVQAAEDDSTIHVIMPMSR